MPQAGLPSLWAPEPKKGIWKPRGPQNYLSRGQTLCLTHKDEGFPNGDRCCRDGQIPTL